MYTYIYIHTTHIYKTTYVHNCAHTYKPVCTLYISVRTFCIMVLVAVSCHKLATFFPQVWQEGTAELHMAGLYHNVQATGFCFWPQFLFLYYQPPNHLTISYTHI